MDLTVAVTAHSETVVAGPTMLSIQAAIRAAERGGLRVDRLIGLDAATADCRRFFSQPDFDAWKIVDLDKRDLGLARNALVEIATGRWIAFCDSDDLVSENWLMLAARSLAESEAAGDRVVVHPEVNWFFDGQNSVLVNPPEEHPLFMSQYFYFCNYYDSMCMAPRKAHIEVPYVARDVSNGVSFQDWQWNIETMFKGWHHVIARDTVIFKRRRDESLVLESTSRCSVIRAIEPMAIDKVMRLSGTERSQNYCGGD